MHNDAANSHASFEEGDTPLSNQVFAPPPPPLDVSAAVAVHEMMLLRFPGGWQDLEHPAPARQWMFVLSGRGQTTAGGDVRTWGPGDIFVIEDTSPPGHGTKVFEDADFAVVRY
jgi:hypothetical protein